MVFDTDDIRKDLQNIPKPDHFPTEFEDGRNDKTEKSQRKDHPTWFEPIPGNSHGGVNPKFQTKEDLMNHNYEERIKRFYKFSRSRSEVDHGKQPGLFEKLKIEFRGKRDYEEAVEQVIEEFKRLLKEEKENRQHFNRVSDAPLCEPIGLFQCQSHDKRLLKCASHSVNPYRSAAERLLFYDFWTLDHM